MAEIWAAGLATAAIGAWAGNKQAGAAKDAASQQLALQQQQFDQTRADQRPFLEAGYDALAAQQRFLAGDTSGFENSADYIFRRDQALQSQERGAAARGGFMGGGADADRIALATGLAGQAANDYWSKLAGRANQGYSAVSNIGAAGQTFANNAGNALANAADARASSYGNIANTAGAVGGLFTNWYGNQQANNPGGSPWYLGNQPGKG